MSQIEFDPGESELNESGTGKLDQLAAALYDRPSLKLDISGYVDKKKDSEGLATVLVENKVKAQKLKALNKKGQATGSLEEVTVSTEEYEVYLAAAVAEAGIALPEKTPPAAGKIEAPENTETKTGENRVAEMERLLKQSVQVKQSDLKLLPAIAPTRSKATC